MRDVSRRNPYLALEIFHAERSRGLAKIGSQTVGSLLAATCESGSRLLDQSHGTTGLLLGRSHLLVAILYAVKPLTESLPEGYQLLHGIDMVA